MSKVAIVTGSNKGIGFAIVKGLCQRFDGIVYLTSRNETRGKAAVEKLNKLGLYPEYHQLDVADRSSVIELRDYIKRKHGSLNILINNAGVVYSYYGVNKRGYEEDENIIDINYRGILTVQELLYPLVANNGRILNISSSCGHLSNVRNKYWIDRLSSKDLKVEDINEFCDWFLESRKNGTFNPDDLVDNSLAAYRVAKVAMSALTILQQKDLKHRNISVNAVHPGLVRTDMTMKIGFCTADEAAETPLYLVLEAPESLKGAYVWEDRSIVDWYDYKSDCYFTMSYARSFFLISVISYLKEFILQWFLYFWGQRI